MFECGKLLASAWVSFAISQRIGFTLDDVAVLRLDILLQVIIVQSANNSYLPPLFIKLVEKNLVIDPVRIGAEFIYHQDMIK